MTRRLKNNSEGFALVASLLLLALMSALALGLLMMVNTETGVGGHDLDNTKAYRSAEGAMEKMSSDLANTFTAIQAPDAATLCALSNLPPTNDKGVSFPVYQVLPAPGDCVKITTSYGQISSGTNQGLYAQIIPITLNVTAQRGLAAGSNNVVGFGDEVSMTRNVEIALIPVFQFGVFSDSDLGFFSSPTLDFAGRVHTNGDLFLGVSNIATITFHDKITAYGNVIRQVLPNGISATVSSNNDQGVVNILTASQGCDGSAPACRAMAQSEGSIDKPTGTPNPSWPTISKSTYKSWILDGNYGDTKYGTGVTKLSLSFVNPGQGTATAAQNVAIIRRPPPTEAINSSVGQARLANEAQIRVLLNDNEADLHLTDWNGDATQDINLGACAPAPYLVNGVTNYLAYANTNANTDSKNWEPAASSTYSISSGAGTPGKDSLGNTKDANGNSLTYNGFLSPPVNSPCSTANGQWPLIPGWLLVEVRYASDGLWHGVTKEWLSLGFARGLVAPNLEKGTTNPLPDHQQAILYLQKLADRNGDGVIGTSATPVLLTQGTYSTYPYPGGAPPIYENGGEGSPYNWYPLNIYDPREGENWDVKQTAGTCTPNGVMNTVEVDVGNLRKWLLNSATGQLVDNVTNNGYILYFSDRRGMQKNPNLVPPALDGEYGFEDTINSANNGVPDGKLEPALPTPAGKTPANGSPEDVNFNGTLDVWGVAHVGDAFGNAPGATFATDTNATVPPTPYRRMQCYGLGRENAVTGARHALKLVNGGINPVNLMTQLPMKCQAGGLNCVGGFTVGSENPVYVEGDYNTSSADPTWTNPSAPEITHAAAAVIADSVTLLSDSWQDSGYPARNPVVHGSMETPSTPIGKSASTTYYRMAIAAGKTMAFSNTTGTPTEFYGTDGGVHNFLRFIEDWQTPAAKLYYKGSMVSLFPSMYATGTFKCCTTVYQPPVRNYKFDPLFAQPANLPPGTPMFRDVDNLSYRQNFVARNN